MKITHAGTKTTISGPCQRPWENTGHQPHRSGAGIHADRRTKRCKTRHNAITRSIKEWT